MTDDREPYGRLVHDTRLTCEADRAAAEGRARFNLGLWEQRDDAQHELDMRIGSAVAAQAVADARLGNERMRVQLLALSAHLPAIRRALANEAALAEHEYDAKQYRAALQALGISDEKGEDRG